ncbi:hypothetical protein [uncultured Ruegeria sp.]|uniref:VirB4 family type IV secretion/conjugal transfer ATPase n=1 Tax=uncultured Ruegeria sp. TaxID=259304 RepID=UPI00260B4021|nr:hypothetical protein [uncultured Ruegeria sp.]
MPKPAAQEMWSIARSLIEPTWRRDETHLFQMLPYGYVVNDTVISTRNGGLLGAAEITGVNAHTLEDSAFEYLAERFEQVLRNTPKEVAFYIHRLSVPAQAGQVVTDRSGFAGAVATAMETARQTADLKERRIVLSAIVAQRDEDRAKQVFGLSGASAEEDRSDLVDHLESVFSTLSATLGDDRVRRLKVSEGRWLGYYGMLLNGRFQPIVHSNFAVPVAFNLPQDDVLFQGKGGTLETGESGARSFRVYSLKNYPMASFPGIFDALDLPVEIVVTQSYLPVSRAQAQETARRKSGQMRSAGDKAASLEADLSVFADAIASGTLSIGKHHLSICIFGDGEALKAAEKHIIGAIQLTGGTLKREHLARRSVYFAQHPGNFAFRPREELITDQNFADMVAFHMRPEGTPAQLLPWPGPLVTFPTLQGERYDLSLHKPKTSTDPDELPSGHTIVLGPNGSGKTVIAMLLAATAVAQGARLIAFDKDRAMEAPFRALGAQYTTVNVGEPTGMNPFQTETDEAGQSWLANWVTALLSYDQPLSAEQREEITRACIANATLPPQLQTFSSLKDRFKAFDDNKNLFKRAGEWCRDGRLAWMFGAGGSDPFAAQDRHLVFDISQVLDDPLVRLAWISYVMRQIEQRCAEKEPTVFVIDEAWVIAGNPYGAKILENAFSTFRKLNVVMMMMTQNPDHILSSQASKSILINTSTQLLFPSATVEEDDYRKLGLNGAEIAALRAHAGERVMLLKNERESVWLDVDIGKIGPLLRVLGGSDGKSFPDAGWRQNPTFWKDIT